MADVALAAEPVLAAPPVLRPEDMPDIDSLVTEDDAPVDNIFSEKQMRLLTEPLYASWPGPGAGRTFQATANVGVVTSVREPPVVPDVLLSLDVHLPPHLHEKRYRSYFLWEAGKPPDVVIEIVSNRVGGELDVKLRRYCRMRVLYYIIFDPEAHLSGEPLKCMEVSGAETYRPVAPELLPDVGLGVTIWRGTFEGLTGEWLRWQDSEGRLILTGAERAERERERAELEHEHARIASTEAARERERAELEREHARIASTEAARERERAERLAERLRALGGDLD
ncbi:MAG: Uma2 family endonuclease [Candidatus Schekmanbacteria bacterium]|nr:Uma2 family endonuclease [Candidatus Schekmanbacteria bacterium]